MLAMVILSIVCGFFIGVAVCSLIDAVRLSKEEQMEKSQLLEAEKIEVLKIIAKELTRKGKKKCTKK